MGPSWDPDGRTVPGRSLAEPSRDKPSRANAGASDPADAYWAVTGKYPTGKTLAWIDDLSEQYGVASVTVALGGCHREDDTVATLLGRVKDVLAREARRLDQAEREAEKARVVEMRKPTVLRVRPPDVSPEEAERIAAEYRATWGQGA